jgi:hypothetical protein
MGPIHTAAEISKQMMAVLLRLRFLNSIDKAKPKPKRKGKVTAERVTGGEGSLVPPDTVNISGVQRRSFQKVAK